MLSMNEENKVGLKILIQEIVEGELLNKELKHFKALESGFILYNGEVFMAKLQPHCDFSNGVARVVEFRMRLRKLPLTTSWRGGPALLCSDDNLKIEASVPAGTHCYILHKDHRYVETISPAA